MVNGGLCKEVTSARRCKGLKEVEGKKKRTGGQEGAGRRAASAKALGHPVRVFDGALDPLCWGRVQFFWSSQASHVSMRYTERLAPSLKPLWVSRSGSRAFCWVIRISCLGSLPSGSDLPVPLRLYQGSYFRNSQRQFKHWAAFRREKNTAISEGLQHKSSPDPQTHHSKFSRFTSK